MDYFEDLTGDIAPSTATASEAIGKRIRTVRRQKAFSLDQLAQLTGFDVDLLAGIEANRVQPQLSTLIKLSKALDSAFGRILSGAGGWMPGLGKLTGYRQSGYPCPIRPYRLMTNVTEEAHAGV